MLRLRRITRSKVADENRPQHYSALLTGAFVTAYKCHMRERQIGGPGFDRSNQSTLTRSSRAAVSTSKERNLGYPDIALFFLGVFMISSVFRMVVHSNFLPANALVQPSLPLQLAISLLLIFNLYIMLLLRHGAPVWSLLGWTMLSRQSFMGAVAAGFSLALLVDCVAHATTTGVYPIHAWALVLVDATIGPFVEESFFRGCLQTVITRTAGRAIGIVVTAAIFASMHQVSTAIERLCLFGTGIAYGWVRTKTNSTSAAGCMHAAYNFALFLCQFRSIL